MGYLEKAIPEDWGFNSKVLTADSIMSIQGVHHLELEKAATKLLAIVLEEQDHAIIEPGVNERVSTTSKTELELLRVN